MISGFNCGVNKVFTLLVCSAALIGSWFPRPLIWLFEKLKIIKK
jgi:hypothetical protein